jgi:hypothetical protein
MYDDFNGIFKSANLEQIYIMDLFEYYPYPFVSDPDQMYVQARLRGQGLSHYVWDARTLAEKMTRRETSGGYRLISETSKYWKPMFVSTITNEQGADDHFKAVDTFNPVSAYAHVDSKALATKFRITTNPVTTNFTSDKNTNKNDYNDPFLKFQNTLYRSFIFPGLPLLFTTTARDAGFLGPQFLSSIEIGVETNTPVKIEIETTGGRILTSKSKSVTQLNKDYRLLKNYDCDLDYVAHNKMSDFFGVIDRKSPESKIKIVSMSLRVKNTIGTTVTALGPYDLVKLGPRYYNVDQRSVTGVIKFIASSSEYPSNLKQPLGYNGLTLYFGGNFLFVLPNILWQKPKVTLTTDNLYLHEYNFTAFAADNASTNAYKAFNLGNYDISEFRLPTDNPNLNLELLTSIRQKKQEDARK